MSQFMQLPVCDECDQEISGPVVKKGLLSLCRPCAKGQPHAAPKAPIAPTQLLPHPALKTLTLPPPDDTPRAARVTPTQLKIDTSKHGCIVVGCPSPIRSRRLCCAHYCAARKTGQINKMPKLFWVAASDNIDVSKQGCIAIGCNRNRKTRGFCGVHYNNVLKHKQTHLLLPAIPIEIRNASVRHIQPVRYLTPEAVMHEIVRIKKTGKSWHQAALLAGVQQPLLAANRTRNLFHRGKIPGHPPPNPHR